MKVGCLVVQGEKLMANAIVESEGNTEHWGNVSGEALNGHVVDKAGEEDFAYFRKHGVPTGANWIGINKGEQGQSGMPQLARCSSNQ
jgi:hypothetical protein